MRQAPSGVQEMFATAMQHHQAGRLSEAERLYQQILSAEPHHADALHFLGVLAHQSGRNDTAVELIRRAIAQNDRVASFHNNLGNALRAQGALQEALACYKRSLALKPDHIEAHYNLGVTLQELGELAAAVASYERALTLKPDHVLALVNLGNALQAQGKLDEARNRYERALTLRPDRAETHTNLGNVLKAQGRLAAAVACHERALTLRPELAEAHNNLGLTLAEQGKLPEAVASYRRALLHRPNYAEAHHNLGNALKEQGLPLEAAASYSRALQLRPDYAEAALGLALVVIPVFAADVAESSDAAARFARALEELAAWNTAHPGKLGRAVGIDQPFYLAYRPQDVTGLLCRYGELVGAAAAAYWQPERSAPADARQGVICGPVMRQHVGARAAGERIRIVVVSAHVRERHPVWDVILRGIIRHLDRTRFEIHLYNTRSAVDAQTQWARAQVDRFVQGPKSTRDWLAEVARDRPAVIFYPEVGMDPAACALAALRLAPLQVSGWGHPVTTGLPSMDLFVSGELLEGSGAQAHYRERLVRLPGTGVCTEWTDPPAQPWQGPERDRATVRFALCQQPIKFDPGDDALLARIAQAAGPCEFWLASPAKLQWATAMLRDRLALAFRAQGLDPQAHLRILPWLPREQFLGFLDAMDVYLDCPAFSGYTTAWQAVHRGLPIVTWEGELMRQRLAAGLLRQMGMTDGVSSSAEQYVKTAVGWAHEYRERAAQWRDRRAGIRAAAAKADGNRPAIRAFEQTLTDGVFHA